MWYGFLFIFEIIFVCSRHLCYSNSAILNYSWNQYFFSNIPISNSESRLFLASVFYSSLKPNPIQISVCPRNVKIALPSA